MHQYLHLVVEFLEWTQLGISPSMSELRTDKQGFHLYPADFGQWSADVLGGHQQSH